MTEKNAWEQYYLLSYKSRQKKVTSAESKQNINVEGKTTVCLKNL